MSSKFAWTAAVALFVAVLHVENAAAQQTLNFSIGAFSPRGEDARVEGDVLVVNRDIYVFEFDDFRSASLSADWLAPLGDYFEVGAGIGWASRGVPTIYDRFTRPDGTEIEQELKLRTIPMSATLRILPLGRNASVQPYVGGGIGLTNWRYSETGDFIDFTVNGRPIFRDSFVATGTAVGPVAIFGVRVPAGRFSFGGEIRYQKAEGDLDENDFLAPKIDLGGFHYAGTIGIRF
jgi:hypothetical protein